MAKKPLVLGNFYSFWTSERPLSSNTAVTRKLDGETFSRLLSLAIALLEGDCVLSQRVLPLGWVNVLFCWSCSQE